MTARRFVQCTATETGYVAVADDGTAWIRGRGADPWRPLLPLPQGDAPLPLVVDDAQEILGCLQALLDLADIGYAYLTVEAAKETPSLRVRQALVGPANEILGRARALIARLDRSGT